MTSINHKNIDAITRNHFNNLPQESIIAIQDKIFQNILFLFRQKIRRSGYLTFEYLDTLNILKAALHLKSPDEISATLLEIATSLETDEIYPDDRAVELVDKKGRPAVPERIIHLLKETLKPSTNIHYGSGKTRRVMMVPVPLWNEFVFEALDWWIKAGDVPEHLLALRLEIDLGI
ncbi:hypothetical protein ACIP01_22370 [Pseudomonas monteilii]|uniref:hypothetical protein n=1 Tax=Pseudomonas monteilii TaxID=76759 RepID=UPI0037F2EB6A